MSAGRRLVILGGSEAGLSAALRARALAPEWDVTVVAADAYPNFSLSGIAFSVSGEVADWRSLAHRTHDDLLASGLNLRLDSAASSIHADAHELCLLTPGRRRATPP
jgi:NADPH-dependent 2,4-dienoyl-CoA reductase/sulfur reductase-like enzyme